MGKPYGHQYFFAGSGCSYGDMTCRHCKQPIFNHNQDWMVYQKSKSYDWSYHCFHRKCREDQTGWEKIETAARKAKAKTDAINSKIMELSQDLGISGFDLVVAVAEAFEIDLDDYYFSIYGSS